ncbi:MAG: hypothetical protein IT324_07615 [Anaerolineae bacterium]|nr:hypothetical protein [Anaerolineae bacterium]
MSKRLHILAIPVLLLILSTIACAVQQITSSLAVSDQPVTFTLEGETLHEWIADTKPNAEYMVNVTRQNSTHPMGTPFLRVEVSANGKPLEINRMVSEDEVKVFFVAPSSGQVKITIYSTASEGGYKYGTFAIKVIESK